MPVVGAGGGTIEVIKQSVTVIVTVVQVRAGMPFGTVYVTSIV